MKKAQIQMMETIAVLLIFMILVALGLIFFSKIMASKTTEKKTEFQDLSSVQIAQIASTLPELQCSQDNILKTNCIDLMKLEVAEPIMQAHENDYFDLFGYSNIKVKRIFPEDAQFPPPPPTAEWTLYQKQPAKIQNTLTTQFPISLYNPEKDAYYFGVMYVEVYS